MVERGLEQAKAKKANKSYLTLHLHLLVVVIINGGAHCRGSCLFGGATTKREDLQFDLIV